MEATEPGSPSETLRGREGWTDRPFLLELFVVVNLAFLILDVYLAHSFNDFAHWAEWIPVYFAGIGTIALAVAVVQEGPRRAAWMRRAGYIVGWGSIAVGLAGLVWHLEGWFFESVTLGAHEEALGEIWHLPSNDPITGRRFIEMVGEEVGQEPSMRAYGYWSLTLAGLFDAQVREVKEVLYQFREPFVMDTSKFEEAFGGSVTPYETAIAETVAWHRTQRE